MVIWSLPLPNNTFQPFLELSILLSADSYLWLLHLVVNIVKAIFKLIFFNLIFVPCCKYTYSKNNVKFLKSTSLELRQELLKLNRIAAASTCCFTRQPFPTIFDVKFFIQVLRNLSFSRSLHSLQ